MKIVKYTAAVLFSIMFTQGITATAKENLPLADLRKYDGRDYGIITPVRDQGDTNLCWAYSATSAAEAYLLKYALADTKTSGAVLSPTQLGYACHNRGADPLGNTSGFSSGKDYRKSEGSSAYAQAAFSQWFAPVAADMTDNSDGWINSKYRLTESVTLNLCDVKNSEEARREMKEAIVKYGAVTFSYNNSRETYYYNPSNEQGSSSYPHACTVIGWDDTIPGSSFLPGGASQDGGWLVKNSYNSLPYFYLSYDNSSSNIYAFAFASKERYDYNYFYDSDISDFGLGSLLKPKCVSNIFEAKNGAEGKKEFVSAVNVGIDGENAVIAVDIYTDIKDESDPTSGNLSASKTLTVKYPGYYTLEFENPVYVKKGSRFSVVAQLSGNDGAYFKLTENVGKSLIKRGGSWNTESPSPRVKAYTKVMDKKAFVCDDEVWLDAGKSENGVFLLGYYGNKKISDAESFEVSGGKVYRFKISKDWKRTKNSSLKGMLWESYETMIPLADVQTLWE